MRKHVAIALFCLIAISCQGTTLGGLTFKFPNPFKHGDSDAQNAVVADVDSSDSIPAVVQQDDSKSNPIEEALKPIVEQNGIFHKIICNLANFFSPLKHLGCEEDVDVEEVPVELPSSNPIDNGNPPDNSDAPCGPSSEVPASDAPAPDAPAPGAPAPGAPAPGAPAPGAPAPDAPAPDAPASDAPASDAPAPVAP